MGASADSFRQLTWHRLKRPAAAVALAAAMIASVGAALGSVVVGRIADHPRDALVWLLVLCVIGAALVDTLGRVIWAGVIDRAEGTLRQDLISAALSQPLDALNEQAVGEILDRVDDDTHEIGSLLRLQMWFVFRTTFGLVPMWIVAGVTWWPAALIFPALFALVWWAIRPYLGRISRLKVLEEMTWTDHAAAMEEGIAGRDDLRTSAGAGFVVRRVAQLSAITHEAFRKVVVQEGALARTAGLILYGALSAIVVAGAWLTSNGHMGVDRLVTLFLVTATFVGQINEVSHRLPDIQAGIGAIVRIRQMLSVEPEQAGGEPVPDGPLSLEFRGLEFRYPEGTFGLHDVSLSVPAGQTIALVGRTGSGKSTLASMIARAIEPPAGSVLLGGVDVTTLDLHQLRSAVGTVTQRTEILAGTLAENIALFADLPRVEIERAVDELGLGLWVAGLPDGLETVLGPGGTKLSAGEEQLVAFARLLVRDVQVVVLDEATARMDPVTEARVVAAAERLLARRTGVLVAHRLSTVERADLVAVLDHGRVLQSGKRSELAAAAGPFRDLLTASSHSLDPVAADDEVEATPVGGRRRTTSPPARPAVGPGPGLGRSIAHAIAVRPRWGAFSVLLFLVGSLCAAQGALSGWLWGRVVELLKEGGNPTAWVAVLTVLFFVTPLVFAHAIELFPRWWVEVLLRIRMSVLLGQTRMRRLERTPPGEVVARTMDGDRFVRYADRWVDFINAWLIVGITMIAGGTPFAGLVLLAVMAAAALASSIGRPIAGRSATRSSAARARFGRVLVSSLEAVRTIKLSARTPQIREHLRRVDGGRVEAAIFEHRISSLLDGVPMIMVQVGVVMAWTAWNAGWWPLATALLVANAVNGFDWFGRVAGAVVTEAPGTRSWLTVVEGYSGGVDIMTLPPGIDLLHGEAPGPEKVEGVPLQRLTVAGLDAVHDDGTVGISGVDLSVDAGELVLLLGQVGSGKSSLLGALAGLLDHTGSIRWNGAEVEDPEVFLRPGQVAHVAQVPRVLSGTFHDNVTVGHDRDVTDPVEVSRLDQDVADAGGMEALVGHRGVRLSGGQVQRLALARALATDAELLLADDVSSALDARTELELWDALRSRGATVIGATSKRAALAKADRVVVLVDGEVAATGPWADLSDSWGHLAG
ncbi:ATP-binding cassette domain-containing protein [Nocardioides sp. Kera G14]|uniref:ATP-binding cassette domain-containing protein n=1 Tax=Nocardioides sp. Kera G14 TaxID=2884264 RepID=UPI001D0F6F92|nr:ABC transporter ATP-binding protein [Nocardioides sp. Kera G14]UDY25334.1 ABC transporter ATP-binding protein/permease [Nocardioides sp. Kera G14]